MLIHKELALALINRNPAILDMNHDRASLSADPQLLGHTVLGQVLVVQQPSGLPKGVIAQVSAQEFGYLAGVLPDLMDVISSTEALILGERVVIV